MRDAHQPEQVLQMQDFWTAIVFTEHNSQFCLKSDPTFIIKTLDTRTQLKITHRYACEIYKYTEGYTIVYD